MMPVDSQKIRRYAHGLAAEIVKAPKRGQFSRAFQITRFEKMLRNELKILDAQAADEKLKRQMTENPQPRSRAKLPSRFIDKTLGW